MKKFLFVCIVLSVSAVFAAEPATESDIKIERIRNKNPEFDGFKIGDDSTTFFVTMKDLIAANKAE